MYVTVILVSAQIGAHVKKGLILRMMTSRELVHSTLEFRNTSNRAPRQLWWLPWAANNFPNELKQIQEDFPGDFGGALTEYREIAKTTGDATEVGIYVDDWNCTLHNLQRGVIGEVKEPLIATGDDEWTNAKNVHLPEEWLTFDTDKVNRSCAESDLFMMGGCCPNPFERLQYIRGTENLYMDLMFPTDGMMDFIKKLHDFYCRLLEKWAKTDVDAVNFMDDWGSQKNLLINPDLWAELFKPMYKDFVDIAHTHGKKIFMHSDGNVLQIYPHLIDIGVDAMNSQLFCMGPESLAPFKGKITFWGEIDRQYILPWGTVEDTENAVRKVYDNLWDNGGCIAQCEFGPGAKPENVRKVFETWDQVTTQGRS